MQKILTVLLACALALAPLSGGSASEVDDQVLAAARAANSFYQRRVESLVAALASEDEAVRIDAIRRMGYLQDPELTGKLLPWLQASNRSSAELITAITALTDTGTAIASTALRKLLNHEDPKVRVNAMNGLTRAKQINKADYLTHAGDSEGALRGSSDANLGLMQVEDAAPILLHNLALDGNPHVRRMCAIALGQIGNREHGPALANALTDANAGVRRYAAEALVKINYTPAIPHMLMAMEANVAGDHIARSLRLMTQQDFGFSSRANPLARQEAIEKGFAWWNQNAKDLNR